MEDKNRKFTVCSGETSFIAQEVKKKTKLEANKLDIIVKLPNSSCDIGISTWATTYCPTVAI